MHVYYPKFTIKVALMSFFILLNIHILRFLTVDEANICLTMTTLSVFWRYATCSVKCWFMS